MRALETSDSPCRFNLQHGTTTRSNNWNHVLRPSKDSFHTPCGSLQAIPSDSCILHPSTETLPSLQALEPELFFNLTA